MFNDKVYKQIHGCAMGSPVSLVVANLCMEDIETKESLLHCFDCSTSRNSFASLPYNKSVTEPLTRVLKKHEITVVNKPLRWLQQKFPIPISRPPLTLQPDIVYKIPCGNCSWSYIGETGRSFATRKKEHIRNIKTSANSRTRKFLESWHTTITPNADNNSCPLPGQYSILVNKHFKWIFP